MEDSSLTFVFPGVNPDLPHLTDYRRKHTYGAGEDYGGQFSIRSCPMFMTQLFGCGVVVDVVVESDSAARRCPANCIIFVRFELCCWRFFRQIF
jgi:hypothetical protein